MELMTNQEIFDKVAKALIKQGKPSTGNDGSCSYYSPDGSRCAIGWLVGEDEAKKLEENYPCGGVQDIMKHGYFEGYDQEFLTALQVTHDRHAVTEPLEFWLKVWKHDMIDIAEDYNLNTEVLNMMEEK